MGGMSTWSFVLVTGVALAVNGEAPAIEASENGVTITVDAGQDVTVITRAGQGEEEKRVSLQQMSDTVDLMTAETQSLWAAISKLQDADDVLTTAVNSKVSREDNDAVRAGDRAETQKVNTALADLQTAVRKLENTSGAPLVCQPFTVENGVVDEPLEILPGVHAQVNCNKLFYVVGNAGVGKTGNNDRQCGSDGKWNSDAPMCKACADNCESCNRKDGVCSRCSGTLAVNENGECIEVTYGSSERNPGKSCKDIQSKLGGKPDSGMYWVFRSAQRLKASLNVWCDMVADGGGWAGIMNVVAQADGDAGIGGLSESSVNAAFPVALAAWSSGTQNLVKGPTVGTWLRDSAVNGYTYSEIRYRCKRQSDGMVVDIKSTSADVLAYFTSDPRVYADNYARAPDACNSKALDGDGGSTLGSNCKYWGSTYVGKGRTVTPHQQVWGIDAAPPYNTPAINQRLYQFPIYISGTSESTGVSDAPEAAANWAFDTSNRKFACDNKSNEDITKGDTWQIFVR